jgi:DNA-binding protein H-NS
MSTSSPRLVDDSTADEWTSTMPTPPALAAVRKAGQRYARAQKARDTAREELAAAIRAAHAAGHAPKELIEASGLARQSVFDDIKKTAADGGPPLEDRPEVVSYP